MRASDTTAPQTSAPEVDNRLAAAFAAVGGLGAVSAAFLTWFEIEIDGLAAPGSFQSGLAGRDGRTVLAAGVVTAVVGALFAFGRAEAWLKLTLLVTGGVITIIALVNLVDASSKADRLGEDFGVPRAALSAGAGPGLWVLLVAGAATLAAGLIARRAAP
jgi:hypothetical protein